MSDGSIACSLNSDANIRTMQGFFQFCSAVDGFLFGRVYWMLWVLSDSSGCPSLACMRFPRHRKSATAAV